MAAQLDYGYSTAKAVPGAKVNLADDEVIARQNEEKAGVLKCGMAVMVGATAGSTVKKPVTGCTSAQIEGVVLANANNEQDIDGVVQIKNGATVGVMKRGNVWGRVAADVTPKYGDLAYVVISGDNAGTFTNKSDDTTVDIGATFGNATDDGIAIVVLK